MYALGNGFLGEQSMNRLVRELSQQVDALDRAEQQRLEAVDHAQVVDYLGSHSCRECHGAVHDDWRTTRHSKALATLQKVQHHRDATCLPSHTVGYGEPAGFTLRQYQTQLVNVGCEVCHGPGEVHVQREKGEALTGPTAGLPQSGLRPVSVDTCVRCHTQDTDPQFSAGKLKLVDHQPDIPPAA
jgi:hypothetical protein